MPRTSLRRPLLLLLAATTLSGIGCGDDGPLPSDAGVDGPGADTAPADAVQGADTAPVTCSYGGQTYALGATFPATDGCNTCTCSATGVGCTKIGCPPRDGGAPDGQATCDFSARYSYGPIGGNSLYVHRSELAPGNKYTHTRSPLRSSGMPLSCSPAMPPCGAQDIITAYDVEVHDLLHPDVRAALAEPQPLLYGHDTRPVDGTVFEFKRADGRGVLVGNPCNGQADCRPIPAGVAQLTKRLRDLDTQQLAAPECQALR
jgi:hypothetical protein